MAVEAKIGRTASMGVARIASMFFSKKERHGRKYAMSFVDRAGKTVHVQKKSVQSAQFSAALALKRFRFLRL